jgi:hypothetical protein
MQTTLFLRRMRFAFLSSGRLFVADGPQGPVEVTSEHGEGVRERHHRLQEKRSWRGAAASDDASRGYALWGNASFSGSALRVRIEGVTQDRNQQALYYFLLADQVGGLFRRDTDREGERRIFHKEKLHLSDLECHPEGDVLLCTHHEGEASHIARLASDRFQLRELTEGDTRDSGASWVPGDADAFVYQSAGIGRNPQGHAVGLGPSAVIRVGLRDGSTQVLMEDPAYDFLAPRMDAQGNLYCIRRNYESERGLTLFETFKEFLMMPMRLLQALFGFLNVMTQMFGKERLLKAGTGQRQEVDRAGIFIKGRYLESMASAAAEDEKGYTPADWTLIRVDASGQVRELCQHVCDFDCSPDGTLLVTNGKSIRRISPDGIETLHKADGFVEQVRILG